MTDHDRWLDENLDDHYSDDEDIPVDDDDWKVDVFIEHEIEMENYYD